MMLSIPYRLPLSVFAVWLFTLSGMIGITLGDAQWFIAKTPINLLVLFFVLVINFPIKSVRAGVVTATIFVAGFLIEWVGVHYGFPFGEYYYGENLGFKIGAVPPLIGINWVMVTLATAAIAQHVFSNIWLRAALGSLLMTGLDVLIEPLAPAFDFWHWSVGHAPLQNFAGWFVFAGLLQFFYARANVKGTLTISLHLYMAQVVFFLYFFFRGV